MAEPNKKQGRRGKNEPRPFFTTQVQASARQDLPYPSRPSVAQDIADLPEPVSLPEDSMDKVAKRAVKTTADRGRPYAKVAESVADIVATRLPQYGGAEVRSGLSTGGWTQKPTMGMSPAFKTLYESQKPREIPAPPKEDAFQRLLSPEATDAAAVPYQDPSLREAAGRFAGQAMTYRTKAEEARAKHPILRRLVPLINANLNRAQVDYQQLAAQADANELAAMQAAVTSGEAFRRRQSLENAGYIGALLDSNQRQFTNAFNAATQGEQLYNQATSNQISQARTDLDRFAALNNPATVFGIPAIAQTMGIMNAAAQADTAAQLADPALVLQEFNAKVGQMEAARRANEASAALGDLKARESADSRLSQVRLAMRALDDGNLETWVRTQAATAEKALTGEGADQSANRVAIRGEMKNALSAAYEAAYEASSSGDPTFKNNTLANTYLASLSGGKPLTSDQEPIAVREIQSALPRKYIMDLMQRAPQAAPQMTPQAYAEQQSRLYAEFVVKRYQKQLQQNMSMGQQ